MIPERYEAPYASGLFSDQKKFDLWTGFTQAYAERSLHDAKIDGEIDADEHLALHRELFSRPAPQSGTVRSYELTTGHDVVAFLAAFTDAMSPALKRHIHYGLTSSDLVDNAHFYTLRAHTRNICHLIDDLRQQMSRWEGQVTVRAGRTHGQIAAPTSWTHQIRVIERVLYGIKVDLVNYGDNTIIKSAGPTGRSPLIVGRDGKIAKAMRGRVVLSTQVIPRDRQVAWAALYLRLAGALENLALLVRLGARSEVQEVAEGAAGSRVGSSAMPHKRNPIDSEKVCGLARVARGYFSTIAEGSALWEDRDLTNSSMERIAVPGLAATVEHMTVTMTRVMEHLRIDTAAMRINAEDPRTMTNILQTLAQKHFNLGPVEAGALVRGYVTFDHESPTGVPWYDATQISAETKAPPAAVDRWFDEAKEVWEGIVGS